MSLIISLVFSAVLAVFASITAPLYLAHRTERLHREDREADYARQDALAAEARLAADEASRALLAANEHVAAAADRTNEKLDIIHTLVNSNMTAAMQSELEAIQREMALMHEVVALNRAAGREPAREALAAIEATQAKITELTIALKEREEAARRVGQLPSSPQEPGRGEP